MSFWDILIILLSNKNLKLNKMEEGYYQKKKHNYKILKNSKLKKRGGVINKLTTIINPVRFIQDNYIFRMNTGLIYYNTLKESYPLISFLGITRIKL